MFPIAKSGVIKYLPMALLAAATAMPMNINAKHNKTIKMKTDVNFNYLVDRFADIQVLRYQVPGFEDLTLSQKLLIYNLTKAAEEGRDILFDQNCRYNLLVRGALERMYMMEGMDKSSDDYNAFLTYMKQVLFANGIHHHYGCEKFTPAFSKEWFKLQYGKLDAESKNVLENLNSNIGETKTAEETLLNVIFDPTVAPKRVNQADGEDLVKTSACNYYLNVSQQEAEAFYNAMKDENDTTPPSYGMNSRLVKKDGKVYEVVWKVGGKYSDKIEKIVYWLEQAKQYAENAKQKDVIETLVEFYKTGDLKTFDEYSIKWVGDTDSRVDFVNGFIETYGDPLDMKASWESIVNFKNIEATRRTQILSENAQWFEDHSPVSSEFKKKEVKGVSAKVITMAFLGGDCYPATPIGINLPNANWIRQMHGSKSVTIENITNAYDKAAQGNGFAEEFMLSDEEIERSKKYAYIADNLHTDLHECLGHGSGQLLPGVSREALKAYGSTIEEARADLFGLYYTADAKMLELGLLPAKDAYKAEYYSYIMNGLLTQLIRIKPGDVIEEAHMRNRALIARWAYEKGKKDNVIELVKKDGKTYVKINSYKELRKLFGVLLAEVQRIRSVGDYEAAKRLVEDYGVQIDPDLHNEILERYRKLNLSPYKGFVNPVYELVKDESGNVVDVKVTYGEDFLHQQLRYDGFVK